MSDPAARASAFHALCVYAESLAARRRVVVVGDSSLGLAERLVGLGARSVHVYDPDAARARANASKAPRGTVVRELPAGDLDVRDGAFDLAIVPDLAAIEERASLLARLRKLVGVDGAAIFSANATDGIDYYELYDLVALQFASVRMIGQLPFVGVALAELGETDDEPAVSVDTQLVDGEEARAPEVFVALASQRDVRLEPYAIVQIPVAAPAPSVAASRDVELADLASAVLRADALASQLEELRAENAKLASLSAGGDRARRGDDLEVQLKERTTKLKDAETRAGEHYVRAERAVHENRRLDEELVRERERTSRLSRELEDERKVRARIESEGTSRRGSELAQREERLALLEEGLRAAEEAAAILQARAEDAEATLGSRERELSAAMVEAAVLREALAQPKVDPRAVEQLAERAEAAESRVAMLEAQLGETHDAQARELAELEMLLRQRAQAIASLEHEITRREGLVRELIETLEESRESIGDVATQPSPMVEQFAAEQRRELGARLEGANRENVELRAKLDILALDVARREAELQSRAWRIAELEDRLSREAEAKKVPGPSAKSTEKTGDVGVLRGELDALRQALTQEHQARVRAESGEDLAEARAELARQAALLQQIAGQLGG